MNWKNGIGCLALALNIQAALAAGGTVKIDGSSTVFPISEAAAEEFQKTRADVRVTVGLSGTGGGFKKFAAGETDISDASRPITDTEREAAAKNKIEYIELPVAYDGIAVLVNPANDFVKSLTVAELKRIWQPDSTVKMWSDIRAEWPKRKINLYGPGTDNGTFDYFSEEIVGKAKSMRPDFTASTTPNVLVQGISGDKDALGYFGFAYYVENQEKLKLVAVDAGKGALFPSSSAIQSGAYRPLSRPIFIYVNKQAAETRPEIGEFVAFYLKNAAQLVAQVGYIPMQPALYAAALERFQKRMTGTVFGTVPPEKRSDIAALLKLKGK